MANGIRSMRIAVCRPSPCSSPVIQEREDGCWILGGVPNPAMPRVTYKNFLKSPCDWDPKQKSFIHWNTSHKNPKHIFFFARCGREIYPLCFVKGRFPFLCHQDRSQKLLHTEPIPGETGETVMKWCLLYFVYSLNFIPLKINMESKNHPIEKEHHLPNLHFWVQNGNSPACITQNLLFDFYTQEKL